MKKEKSSSPIDIGWIAIIIVAVIIALTGIISWRQQLDYSQMIATAGLLFAVAAIYGVLHTMRATSIQLRKVMAKPKLEVMFSENGKKEWVLDCTQRHCEGIPLWINNTGKAIAELYSVDLVIPNIFMPTIQEQISGTTHKIVNEKATTVSFINNRIGRYICFVNKPVQIEPVLLNMDPDRLEQYENPFKIKYFTYGNWDEVQKGEFKVLIRSNKEATHA